MYRIDSNFVKHLQDEGYDVWTISLWESWLSWMPEFESTLSAIDAAFQNTSLGSGIGLREADAIDGYASNVERAEQRELDEKHDWHNIDAETLNQNYVAPIYLDAKGFHFLLPAFLLAELNGTFSWDFISRLTEKRQISTEWIELLDELQANSLISLFELLKQHPDYFARAQTLELAIARIRNYCKGTG